MKAVIYDENNLDSIFAAACLASVKDVKVFEQKEVIPNFSVGEVEEYLWIGVIPTRHHFALRTTGEFTKVPHTALVNTHGKVVHPDIVPNLSVIHSRNEKNLEYELFSYGEKTLTERVLVTEGINPESFIGVISLIKEFYKDSSTDILDTMFTVLNVKEALISLKQKTLFCFIPTTKLVFMEAANDLYTEMKAWAQDVINNRSRVENVVSKKDHKELKLYNFYEHENFWFIQKILNNAKVLYRNISVTATGTVVTSNAEITSQVNFSIPVNVK